jgi:hypothetical protein
MSTDTIRAKYDIGFDDGKTEMIKTAFSYGVIGLVIGAIVQISIKIFRNNPGVVAGAVGGAGKMAYD